MKKVTDLEEFVLSQILWPYLDYIVPPGSPYLNKMDCLPDEFGLDKIVMLFENNPEWAGYVLLRVKKCGFYFPDYIKHPIVDFIQNYNYENHRTNQTGGRAFESS